MSPREGWTPKGKAATDVVLQTFRANGLFLAAGDVLAGEEGLTAARWLVLGAVEVDSTNRAKGLRKGLDL